jgi:hypothetical protein
MGARVRSGHQVGFRHQGLLEASSAISPFGGIAVCSVMAVSDGASEKYPRKQDVLTTVATSTGN